LDREWRRQEETRTQHREGENHVGVPLGMGRLKKQKRRGEI